MEVKHVFYRPVRKVSKVSLLNSRLSPSAANCTFFFFLFLFFYSNDLAIPFHFPPFSLRITTSLYSNIVI